MNILRQLTFGKPGDEYTVNVSEFKPGVDFRTLMQREDPARVASFGNFFNQILVGDFIVSIQAGEGNYSTPREFHPTPFDYTEFEVAIFLAENHSWVIPDNSSHELFRGFENWEGATTSVAGWVDVETVQGILEFLAANPISELPTRALPPAPTDEPGEMVWLTADQIRDAIQAYVKKFGRNLNSVTLHYGEASFRQDAFGASVELD